MILDSGVAELANTGNRHDFRYRTWPCKNVLRTSVLGASTPGMSQAAITVISGLVPRMLMTRVDPFLLSCGEPISRVRVGRRWPASRCFRVHQRSRQNRSQNLVGLTPATNRSLKRDGDQVVALSTPPPFALSKVH